MTLIISIVSLITIGMIVARVRLNRVDTLAFNQCFRVLFETMKEDHPKFAVGMSLLGIITDWSDQQYNGLANVVSEDVRYRDALNISF